MILNPFVKAAIRSLRDEPGGWEWSQTGRYQIEHKRTGIHVWVANGVSGMDVNYQGTVVWGGVTMASTFLLSINHWALWFAARQWEKNRFAYLIDRMLEKPE